MGRVKTETEDHEWQTLTKVGKSPHAYTGIAVQRGGSRKNLTLEDYRRFLEAKVSVAQEFGFTINPNEVNPICKPHQRDSIAWAVRGGRRAIFASFGLGKSLMQLEILRLIIKHAGGRALIVAPLGVKQEFKRDALEKLGFEVTFIRSMDEVYQAEMFKERSNIYITNYETVRDGKLDPANFTATSLDEAAILRGFGGTKTFREFMRLFETVKYRFVATATPDPNEYIEMLAYSAYLGIMDVSGAKTKFFKRDSTQADKLTIHPHREEDFWMWVATWALFISKPSDLGYDDEGYALPPLEVIYHEIPVDHNENALTERDGQQRLFRDAIGGVTAAAKEKRDTLPDRVAMMKSILQAEPQENFILWHDLEAERHAIQKAAPKAVIIHGKDNTWEALQKREQNIIDFSDGKFQYLGGKPMMLGSGCNFQRHCSRAIFVGIGFKFNDFIQAIHRLYRFLQTHPVKIHLIYAESERGILATLKAKWDRYNKRAEKMTEIIKKFGLSQQAMMQAMQRSMGCERVEVKGQNHTLVNNDSVEELRRMESDSVGLVLTSIPFSTQYEYSPSFNDFGHTESNAHFFEQMDFLTPELLRVLKPGRVAAVHVKDRIVPGGLTGLGFQTLYPFHLDCVTHFMNHGFALMGIKTVVTDVVRENNQTYRLGWTEQCKDGSKMGCGVPEYVLLFRKPPTDASNAYADDPVIKQKKNWSGEGWQNPTGYSRARWQIDAHGFMRSSGNRALSPDELSTLPHHAVFKLFRKYSLEEVYDFEYHVRIGEALEQKQRLPVTFMLLQPASWHEDVWTDITRMRTLNGAQSAKGRVMHLCPMQFDIADRVIAQLSNEGDIVLDPFSGLGTVPRSAVILKRQGYGIELAPNYFADACLYLEAAERQIATPSLFDVALEDGEFEQMLAEESAAQELPEPEEPETLAPQPVNDAVVDNAYCPIPGAIVEKKPKKERKAKAKPQTFVENPSLLSQVMDL